MTLENHQLDRSVLAIEAIRLTKSFGDFCALDQCDLQIRHGEVLGLLGPNGAGKSTLIRTVMGFLNPTKGSARIHGIDANRQRQAAHRLVSYLPSSPRLFRSMKAMQVLKFFASIRSDGELAQSQAVARQLDLDLSRWVAFMSTGMKQKLALAVAFGNRAPVLILDEPTENLDPNVRQTVVDLVGQARRDGRTVLFSSHVLSEVEQVADRVALLQAGKLVFQQTIRDLKNAHRVTAQYSNGMPQPPTFSGATAKVIRLDTSRIQIDVTGDLGECLPWFVELGLKDLTIEGGGLRAVYQQHHQQLPEVVQ